MKIKDGLAICQLRAEQWRAEAKRCKAVTDSLHAKRAPAKEMTDEQREEIAQAITDRISAIAKAQEAEVIADLLNGLFDKESRK